jgi:Spy/CpxP family protein refolding chaperone
MRIRPLLAAIGLLLLAPASALAAAPAPAADAGGTDHTTEIMFGLILVLMIGMVVIGIAEQRKAH